MNEITTELHRLQADFLERVTENLAEKASDEGKISNERMDENQLIHYNLAYHTAEKYISEVFANHAAMKKQEAGNSSPPCIEEDLSLLFAGDALSRLRAELSCRFEEYRLSDSELNSLFSPKVNRMIQNSLAPKRSDFVARQVLDGNFGSDILSQEHTMIRDTFRGFADDVVASHAERVHRNNEFIPDEILNGLSEMGAFGVAIPSKYGGCLDEYGNIGMLIVTEELSRGGLSIAGSLITRPEILSKALLKGGTESQKSKWLPALASGTCLNAVAVTEPDYGSDVARIKLGAEKTEGGWIVNGVKTWCTFAGFADVIMVLVRTEKDPSLKHKGLSILMIEKPRSKEHKFSFTQEKGGSITASSIPTIGYRGMHSYELNFENYFVPDENLIGEKEGRGKGFYLQMAGFAGGRIQTAARANGVMQAALEAASRYASERKVFGKEVGAYQLTRWKLARMASIIQASRIYSHHVAKMLDEGKGNMEATLIKFYASRISEWVTREAMQIHGGMGYAEEYAVSRYFVDARVFSIFEGAEEVMALRVCARELLKQVLERKS